jgi:hypothetical protein
MRSSDGKDLPLFKHIKTDKKIAIGVVNHCDTVVEPAEKVAALIRKALEFIPKEKLIISTDCGFGREGLSRPHRVLQMRGAGRGHQHRAPRARPAGSARARRRSEAVVRGARARVIGEPGCSSLRTRARDVAAGVPRECRYAAF